MTVLTAKVGTPAVIFIYLENRIIPQRRGACRPASSGDKNHRKEVGSPAGKSPPNAVHRGSEPALHVEENVYKRG